MIVKAVETKVVTKEDKLKIQFSLLLIENHYHKLFDHNREEDLHKLIA